MRLSKQKHFYQMMPFSVYFAILCILNLSSVRCEFEWWKNVGMIKEQPPISFRNLLPLLASHRKTLTAINIGGQDGILHDPTYELYRDLNYTGLIFEGDPEYLPILRTNIRKVNQSGKVFIVEEYVKSSSIKAHLSYHNIPQNFDVLKIDIDSFDFAIIKAILDARYKPNLVVMEINQDIPPPFQVHILEKNFTFDVNKVRKGFYGVSADTLYHYFTSKGYITVDIEIQGPEHNMWFALKSLLDSTAVLPLKWESFVNLFWYRLGKQTNCIHMEMCLINQLIPHCSGRTDKGLQASLNLVHPHNYQVALQKLGNINNYLNRVSGSFKNAVSGRLSLPMNYVNSKSFKESQCNYTSLQGNKPRIKEVRSWKFYSQLKEDKFLLTEYFWTMERGVLSNGIFLEVGALDGITYSNTAFFDKFLNWMGVLIEGCPTSSLALKSNRPNAIKVLKAVCPVNYKNRSVEFTIPCGPTSGVAGNNGDTFQRNERKKAKVMSVPCSPMSEIIRNTNMTHIDLMSVDVEGFELSLLQSIDFNAISIHIMIVEVNHNAPHELLEIRKLMQSKGFTSDGLIGEHYGDELWRNPNFIPPRAPIYSGVPAVSNIKSQLDNTWRLRPCEKVTQMNMNQIRERDALGLTENFEKYVASFDSTLFNCK
jgi:FkbM family methyltransferase